MKNLPITFSAVLMLALFAMLIPASATATGDPFVDAGFIQARKKIPALDLNLEDLNGDQVRLSDFRGKVVMLFFWTTW